MIKFHSKICFYPSFSYISYIGLFCLWFKVFPDLLMPSYFAIIFYRFRDKKHSVIKCEFSPVSFFLCLSFPGKVLDPNFVGSDFRYVLKESKLTHLNTLSMMTSTTASTPLSTTATTAIKAIHNTFLAFSHCCLSHGLRRVSPERVWDPKKGVPLLPRPVRACLPAGLNSCGAGKRR